MKKYNAVPHAAVDINGGFWAKYIIKIGEVVSHPTLSVLFEYF